MRNDMKAFYFYFNKVFFQHNYSKTVCWQLNLNLILLEDSGPKHCPQTCGLVFRKCTFPTFFLSYHKKTNDEIPDQHLILLFLIAVTFRYIFIVNKIVLQNSLMAINDKKLYMQLVSTLSTLSQRQSTLPMKVQGHCP